MPVHLAVLRPLLDLAWPEACAGCGAWGRGWCPHCQAASAPAPFEVGALADLGVRVVAAASFEGPLRTALTAFKDGGRTDLRRPLSNLLRAAGADALRPELGARWWHVVPVPSSSVTTRKRGRYPLGELAAALDGPGLKRGLRLTQVRRTQDQSRLGRQERARNLEGAFVAKADRGVGDQDGVLLVDDVVTSGATLRAAVQAVTAVTPGPVVAATVAATPLRKNTGRKPGEELAGGIA